MKAGAHFVVVDFTNVKDTGGDIPEAVAAYYQGLGSVRDRGMLPDTQKYVNDVLALRARFLASG